MLLLKLGQSMQKTTAFLKRHIFFFSCLVILCLTRQSICLRLTSVDEENQAPITTIWNEKGTKND